MTQRAAALVAFALLLFGVTIDARASITRIQITRVESPTFGGVSFGDVGPYEKLIGRAFGEIDPRDPLNAVITDLERAPRNARGMVEYATDIYILRPIDRSKGNHRLFFDHASYISAVTSVAQALRQQRLLLDADLQAYVNAAANSTNGR